MVLLSNCGNRHQMMYVYKILPYAPVNNLKAKSTNNTFTAIMLNAYNPCLSIPFVFIYRYLLTFPFNVFTQLIGVITFYVMRMLFFNRNNSFGINKPIFPLFVCWLDTQFDAMIQKLFFRFTFDIMGTQNRVYFLVRFGPILFVES